MGWLDGSARKDTALAIADGRQNFMQLDPFGPGRNLAGTIEQDGSYGNYATAGYGRNELVYSCIRYRAESLPQSVLRVYPDQVGPAEPIEDHRLRQLFAQPNDVTDEFAFWELSSTYKDLAGTSFWLVVNGRDGMPSQIWPLRPDLVGVLPSSKTPADFVWIYRPDPQRPDIAVPIEDAGNPRSRNAPAFIIRVRYPNPNPNDLGQPYYGQPPLRPAARIVSLDNAATDFVDNLLRNHAMPSVVVESEAEVTQTIADRLKSLWRQAFGGVNQGAPAFLQKGMKVSALGFTLTNLEFPDLRDQSETRICAAFGVEPILVGTKVGLTHNAYKDYREARLSFWEEAMVSEQRRFIEPVRSRLLPRFAGIGRRRVRVDWDNSGVLALREPDDAKWRRATEALGKGGITVNDFRVIVGLPQVQNGDVFLTPTSVTATPVGEDPSAAAGSIEASLGLMAAEFGIELSADELAKLRAVSGMEG